MAKCNQLTLLPFKGLSCTTYISIALSTLLLDGLQRCIIHTQLDVLLPSSANDRHELVTTESQS